MIKGGWSWSESCKLVFIVGILYKRPSM